MLLVLIPFVVGLLGFLLSGALSFCKLPEHLRHCIPEEPWRQLGLYVSALFLVWLFTLLMHRTTLAHVILSFTGAGVKDPHLAVHLLVARRVSFALTTVYIISWIAISSCEVDPDDEGKGMEWRFSQFPTIICLYFLIPERPFNIISAVCTLAGLPTILVQALTMVDFSYTWNKTWMENADDTNNQTWLYALVAVSLVLLLGSFTGMGFLFWYYWNGAFAKCILLLTLFGGVAVTVYSVLPHCEHGALLPSSVIFTFCTCLTWFALSYSAADPLTMDVKMWIEVCGSTAIVIYGCYLATLDSGEEPQTELSEYTAAPSSPLVGSHGSSAVEHPPPSASENSIRSPQPPTATSNMKDYGFLSIFMIEMSCYLLLALTYWNRYSGSRRLVKASFIIQSSAPGIVLLMYGWSLVAPKLFPDREFL